jgi:hypothetical protein
MFSTRKVKPVNGSPAAVVVVVACSREHPRPRSETRFIRPNHIARLDGRTNTFRRIHKYAPQLQKRLLAMRAPSAIAANFAHTTSGSTAAWPTQVPNPQSLPAITFSRPTSLA